MPLFSGALVLLTVKLPKVVSFAAKPDSKSCEKMVTGTGSGSTTGGVLDPFGPRPFAKVAITSCWATCNSNIRAAVLANWLTPIVDPLGYRTIVSPGLLNTEVSRDRLLGHQFEYAVLEVFVGDAAVIQECDVRICGLRVLHRRENQGSERQHANATGMGGGANASERRLDPEAVGLGELASNESEGTSGHLEQGRM